MAPASNPNNRALMPVRGEALAEEARRLERRFFHLDDVDAAVRKVFETALRPLAQATESERSQRPWTPIVEAAVKAARGARDTVFVSQDDDTVSSRVLEFRRAALKDLTGDGQAVSGLIPRLLALVRASCRATAAILDFADLENAPRYDEVAPWHDKGSEFVQDGLQSIDSGGDPVIDHPAAPRTRIDAAQAALTAARRKLDPTVDPRDQLNSLVNLATDPTVLCRMYEGWAPWI